MLRSSLHGSVPLLARTIPRPCSHAFGFHARSLPLASNARLLLLPRSVPVADKWSWSPQPYCGRRWLSHLSSTPPPDSAASNADATATHSHSATAAATARSASAGKPAATSALDALKAAYHRIFPSSNAAATSHYSPSSSITSSTSPPHPDHSASPADLSPHHTPAAATAAAASASTSSTTPQSTLHTLSIESQDKTLRYAFIGNITIASLKLAVFLLTSSQAMFAEFIHTFIDTVNQSLLLLGAQQAAKQPDHRHQMGYGRAPYFFSLISALNLFWFGVVFNTYHTFMYASSDVQLHWYTWAVLGVSLLIDGTVLRVSVKELLRHKPANRSMWKHWKQLKNPLVIGTIMEDVAAVTGVGLAAMGIGLSHLTGNIVFDHIASLSISGLLLYTSYALIRTNYRYLLGFSLSPTVQHNITTMIKSRRSVQCVYTVRGEWTSSDSFAFRCQLDFDGAYFSALLEDTYASVFRSAALEGGTELRRVMGLFAEDVTRLVEEEVVMIEADIRAVYPQAAFIELECAGESSWRMALAGDEARKRVGDVKVDQTAVGMAEQRSAEQRASSGVVYNRRLVDKQKERREEDRDALVVAEPVGKRIKSSI